MKAIKKYSNRRLYDTEESRYITLEELAEQIRTGADVRVVDAKTNKDLTQATLTQIIIESRGAGRLLPVPLLTQLIRLGDDALADFFGRYVSWALELYLKVRQGTQASPFAPFGGLGFPSAPPPSYPPPSGFSRMFGSLPPWMAGEGESAYAAPREEKDDVASLRREMEELKEAMLNLSKRKKK